jgi:hypothetical protein
VVNSFVNFITIKEPNKQVSILQCGGLKSFSIIDQKKMENFAALVLNSKVLHAFEVKIFNSLKWATKFTYASSLFSIASSKQGFVSSIL